MTHDDDMTLLRRWRAGDRQAGDVLIRRHYPYALRIAKQHLTNEDDAVEATQQAMTILAQKQEEIEEDFRAYMAKVAYFCALTQTKSLAKQSKHEPLDDEGLAAATPPRGASTTLAQKEEEKLMVRALRSLPIEDQLVFYYDFVGEKSRTEIARLLGLPPRRIYKRVHKAKERLREQLQTFRESPVRQSTLGGLETWLKSVCMKAPASVDGGS